MVVRPNLHFGPASVDGQTLAQRKDAGSREMMCAATLPNTALSDFSLSISFCFELSSALGNPGCLWADRRLLCQANSRQQASIAGGKSRRRVQNRFKARRPTLAARWAQMAREPSS